MIKLAALCMFKFTSLSYSAMCEPALFAIVPLKFSAKTLESPCKVQETAPQRSTAHALPLLYQVKCQALEFHPHAVLNVRAIL